MKRQNIYCCGNCPSYDMCSNVNLLKPSCCLKCPHYNKKNCPGERATRKLEKNLCLSKKIFLFLIFTLSLSWADKAQLQSDIRHTGQTSDTVQLDTLLWQRQLSPIDPLSGPITFGLRIFISTSRGLWCLTNTTGDSLWVVDDSSAFYGTPAIIGNKIVAIKGQTIVCYDFDGQHLWKTSGFPAIPSHPAVSSETIFVTCHKRVYAFDSAGNSLWVTDELPYPMSRNMTVSATDSWVIANTVRGISVTEPTMTIVLISHDGRIVSARGYGYGFAEGGGCCSPVISLNSDVQVSNYLPNSLYGYWRAIPSVNPLPNQHWQVAGGSYDGSAATHDSLVLWPGNGLTAISLDGRVQWTAGTGRISFSSPLIDGLGKIYIGNDAGELLKIDPVSGLIQLRLRCGNTPLTAPASTSDGKIIICSTAGMVFCFGQRPVSIREAARPQNQPRLPNRIYNITGRRIRNLNLTQPGIYFRIGAGRVKKSVKKFIKFY